MSASTLSHESYTTFTRRSLATEAAQKLAGGLLRWSDRHSRVVQLSHEEMALRLANDRVLEELHDGWNW